MLAVILRADGTYQLLEDAPVDQGIITVDDESYRVLGISRCPQWQSFAGGGLPSTEDLDRLSMEEAVYTVGVWGDDVGWPINGGEPDDVAATIKVDVDRLYDENYADAKESATKKKVRVDQLHVLGMAGATGLVVILIVAMLFGSLVGWF